MSNASFHCTSKVLSFIDTRPKDYEVKGAVKLDLNLREYLPAEVVDSTADFIIQPGVNSTTFATFDKQEQLNEFVAQLCTQLGLNTSNVPNLSDHFSLMFEDRRRFVTEMNKNAIKQGFILKLTASPTNYARYFLSTLGASTRPLSSDQLSLFGSLCMDNAFAEAFNSQQGIQRLSCVIEEAADWHPFFDSNGSGSMLLGLMHALLQLMQLFPQLVPWTALSSQFVKKIAFFVNGQSKLEQNDSRALALELLLALTEHCEHLHDSLKHEVPVDSLIRHLDNIDQRVLLGSLGLMNSIYALGDREERIAYVKRLHELPFIAAITRVLARECPPCENGRTATTTTSPPPASEQKSQLCERLARLQHIRFDEVHALAMRIPSDKEIDFLKVLDEFSLTKEQQNVVVEEKEEYVLDAEKDFYANIPFQEAHQQQHRDDWEAFRKIVQPTPPGLLAICAILDITRPPAQFIQQQEESAAPTIAMTNQQACWAKLREDPHFIGRPSLFPQILAKLVAILIQVLGICGNSTVGQRFGISLQPRFWRFILKCERPFYDLYRILVETFYRSWRDMNAKPDELEKVFNVVKDQFERAMVENPDTLEQLEMEMLQKRFSYFNMQKIWKREQLEQEELEMNSEDIQSLRDHLRLEFQRLVIRRRISILKKGQNFRRILPAKNKEHNNHPSSTALLNSPIHSGNLNMVPQYWFWRLDDREKYFSYWDCRLSGGKPTDLMLETHEKLPVDQIQSILYGPELTIFLGQQHGMKLHKKDQNILIRCGLCLEIHSSSQQEYFLLCAQNEQELNYWLEAINCLCSPKQALQSANLRTEIDRLIALEVQIRLMDIPSRLKKEKPTETVVPELPNDLSWIPSPHK